MREIFKHRLKKSRLFQRHIENSRVHAEGDTLHLRGNLSTPVLNSKIRNTLKIDAIAGDDRRIVRKRDGSDLQILRADAEALSAKLHEDRVCACIVGLIATIIGGFVGYYGQGIRSSRRKNLTTLKWTPRTGQLR